MYPVYLITCNHPSYGANIKGYVGCCPSGQIVEKRFKEHLGLFGGAKHLTNAIKKLGKEWFQVEQIDAGNTPEQALELEKFWIARLGTFGSGYNMTVGGDNPPRTRKYGPLSEATKEKLRVAHRGQKPSTACLEGSRRFRAANPDWHKKCAEAHCGLTYTRKRVV